MVYPMDIWKTTQRDVSLEGMYQAKFNQRKAYVFFIALRKPTVK